MNSEVGRIAYEARFTDARPREFDPWHRLTPEVKAVWARVETAVIDATSSRAYQEQASGNVAALQVELPAISTAAIVPSVVVGESFVVIQEEDVQLLQRIDRGPFFVPLLELAYIRLVPWNGDTLIPRLVSCGWAEMAPRGSRAVRITDAGRRALTDFDETKLKERGEGSAA